LGGALEQKLDAWKYGIDRMAKAYENRKVPLYYIEQVPNGSKGGPDTQFQQWMTTTNMNSMKGLGLNMNVRK